MSSQSLGVLPSSSLSFRRDRIGVGHSFFIRYHLSWLKCVHLGHPLRKKQKWSIQCTHKGEFEFDDGISLSFCPLCGSGRDSNLFYVFSIYKHAGFRLFSASASLGQKFAPEWTRGDNFFETERHNKAFHIDQRSSGGVLPFDSAD